MYIGADVYAAGLMLAAILTRRYSFFKYFDDTLRKSREPDFSQMKMVYGEHNLKHLAFVLYKNIPPSKFTEKPQDTFFEKMSQHQEKMDGKMSTFIKQWKNSEPKREVRLISEDKHNYLLDFLDNLTEFRFWYRPTPRQMLKHPFVVNIAEDC